MRGTGTCMTLTSTTGRRGIALGEKVVLELSDSIKGRHHQFFFDNYFTSVNLLSTLLANGTFACGTIRTNRKQYPVETSDEVKKFSCGESEWKTGRNSVEGQQSCEHGFDTCRSRRPHHRQQTTKRRHAAGSTLRCPVCVALYNRYMGV